MLRSQVVWDGQISFAEFPQQRFRQKFVPVEVLYVHRAFSARRQFVRDSDDEVFWTGGEVALVELFQELRFGFAERFNAFGENAPPSFIVRSAHGDVVGVAVSQLYF